jgi:Domain of unknown function (DUF4276)
VVKPFSVHVYVEGGGPTRSGDLADECRKGFSTLFAKATGRRIGITACDGRNQAYDAFATAVRQRKYDLAILLVDSEEVVRAKDPWTHLHLRDKKWEPLEAPAHLMVVCMEAWLLADHEALRAHFGNAFDAGKIPKWPKLWEVNKDALYGALKEATKERTKGGPYDKGRDSFKILARVDPAKLEACAHAKALFDELKRRSA